MKTILVLLFTSYMLLADALPQRIETSIKSVNHQQVQLNNSVPRGMSGIVVHNYGNGLIAITHAVISQGDNRAKIIPYSATLHQNIPSVQTDVQANDKVILGNFYNNVLLIAPDAKSYTNITKRFKKIWIHPDAYALDFMKEGLSAISKNSLQKFAQANQVGLVLIATQNKLLILDPISKKFLGQMPLKLQNNKALKPFFSRFEQMDVSLFGFSKVILKEYFQAVKEIN